MIGYIFAFSYPFNLGYPVSTYGENAFILAQDVVVVILIFFLADKKERWHPALFVAVMVVLLALMAAFVSGFVGMATITAAQAACVPIFTLSKFPQIVANFRSGSTGQLALVTYLLNFVGSVMRVFTTLKELGPDVVLLTGYGSAALLNGTILAQIIIYNYLGATKRATPAAATKKPRTKKNVKTN
eukprot:TRINITY_DN4980_c0_g1_i2.p2 TRINITY_DN4980_c0_g1~~TRINITY_DN4980_c0_g1_i2.p2  ORF type:complete len:186 (+),score=68.99 TRINITY_DN4980_c0_g1_i2:464-1021(+)